MDVHVPVEGFKGFKPLKPFAYPYPYPSKPLPLSEGKGTKNIPKGYPWHTLATEVGMH